MDKKQILVKNQKLYFYEKDNNCLETIIFLHGWGQSAECFIPIIDNIKNKNIVAVDLPGFGLSEEPKTVFGIEDYVEVINEFLKMKDIKNITLIGHSFGCRIGILLAPKNNSIKKLIFTGAAGIKPQRDIKYYLSVYGYKFQKFLVKTPFYSQYKDDVLNRSGSIDYQNASEQMKKVLIKTVNEDLTNALKHIEQKTLLYWGENDEATPIKDAKLMNSLIKNSRLKIVAGTHYAFLENKEDFIKEINKF